MALTKDKLITHLETQLGMGRQEFRIVLESLLRIIKETLSQGEDLLISGFGNFFVRQNKMRRGRSPQTKKGFILSAHKIVVFRTLRVLRQQINEG